MCIFFCCGNAESLEPAVRLYHKRMVALTKYRSNYMRKTDKSGQKFWGAREFFWELTKFVTFPTKCQPAVGYISPEIGNLTHHPNSTQPFKHLYFQSQTQSQCYVLPRRERSFGNSKRKHIFKMLFSYLPCEAISSSHDILSEMEIDSVTYSTLDIYTTGVDSLQRQIPNRSPTKVSSTTK